MFLGVDAQEIAALREREGEGGRVRGWDREEERQREGGRMREGERKVSRQVKQEERQVN